MIWIFLNGVVCSRVTSVLKLSRSLLEMWYVFWCSRSNVSLEILAHDRGRFYHAMMWCSHVSLNSASCRGSFSKLVEEKRSQDIPGLVFSGRSRSVMICLFWILTDKDHQFVRFKYCTSHVGSPSLNRAASHDFVVNSPWLFFPPKIAVKLILSHLVPQKLVTEVQCPFFHPQLCIDIGYILIWLSTSPLIRKNISIHSG